MAVPVLSRFLESLESPAPPPDLPPLVHALWYERKGDWSRAHEIAQDVPGREAAWVHAYLHRREGDLSNARYWYGQADQPVNAGEMDDEWTTIVSALLAGQSGHK